MCPQLGVSFFTSGQAWWGYPTPLWSIQVVQLFVHLFEKQPALGDRDERGWLSSP